MASKRSKIPHQIYWPLLIADVKMYKHKLLNITNKTKSKLNLT